MFLSALLDWGHIQEYTGHESLLLQIDLEFNSQNFKIKYLNFYLFISL